MSKKTDSAAAMQRAVDAAKADRARAEKKLKRDKEKAAGLRAQVRQMEADAARHGVDLNQLPTKKQARAAAEAAQAETARENAEAERRTKSTAERMGEALADRLRGPFEGAPSVRHQYPARSADRIALGLLDDGLIGRQADPSRNVLPVGSFLRPVAEVVADQAQYRQPAQTRIVPPQATTRNPLHRPWGAAPGQLGGVKLAQDGDR